MKPAIKKQWVAALRSGKYKQTEGALKEWNGTSHRSGYCCLGVLRELMPAKVKEVARKGGDELLSSAQLKWAGLTEKRQLSLAKMNDEVGYDAGKNKNYHVNDFKKIADHIEKNL